MFIDADITPTNNFAEQVIRSVVIDRKITQGCRSDWGNTWMERFWSVSQTCKQQGRFLQDCYRKLRVQYACDNPNK
ncbi:hypothetical protein FACS189443_1880 [Planctomycetales bacterium]|nr:hypothetical protein FACS189443_1880 [Planctomycetales bacterium]